ncbi:MAG: stage V sporulation protein SpoVM [Clostridia bacterium]|nr:stage V sporulation protein SpoVM [Clostridia bacterium]
MQYGLLYWVSHVVNTEFIRRQSMKVVLVKSPKFLCGFLRMIFGIKKQNV